MKANLVYITVGSMEEARRIGKDLVLMRLAAGVNILDHMNAIYWWKGKVRDEREMIVVAKTRESLVPHLIERVKSMHSYECPCIVSIPIMEGNRDFLDWIETETRRP